MTEGTHHVKQIRTVAHFLPPNAATMIMPLWRQRYDTLTIAQTLGVPECVVANRLANIRDGGHGCATT